MTENYFTLWDAKMNTVDVLSGHDLVLNDVRTFTFTVDSSPADGRRRCNWLDTCGMREGMLTLRMAEFPGKRPREDLGARGRVVKLALLREELPASTVWVSFEERARQRRDRRAAYLRRLPEVAS